MKQVFLKEKHVPKLYLDDLSTDILILAKKQGKHTPVSAIIKEPRGWIMRTSKNTGMTGYHETREKCMLHSSAYGYEYFVLD